MAMTSPTRACIVAALLAGAATMLHSAPFTPTSDEEIVQRLPAGWDAQARRQRAALARAPAQLGPAVAAAQAAIVRSRRNGDLRELGQAQAALAPWWSLARPPPAVLLLRAIVSQRQHEFGAALADLDALVDDRSAPLALQAQAGLTRASVLQVTGRLGPAAQACQALVAPRFAGLGAALSVPARACLAELRSLQGDPRQAAAELAALAQQEPGDRWLALLRAELAHRQGDARAAGARFAEARAGTPDVYTRAAHADWLLDQGQPRAALAALEDGGGIGHQTSDSAHTADTADAADESDALLLRRAIALHRLGDHNAGAAAAVLAARFEAAQRRGRGLHLREQARFELEVRANAELALSLARRNWLQQKEPADAVLLLRAAQQAGQPAAADTLRDWVADPARADLRLAALSKARRP